MEDAKEKEFTLTFKLTLSSATPITKDSDTATIYIGKMQTDITTNDLATKINEGKIDNDKKLNSDANKSQLYQFDYDYSLSENTDYLVFTNSKKGDNVNELSVKRFLDIISTNIMIKLEKSWKLL